MRFVPVRHRPYSFDHHATVVCLAISDRPCRHRHGGAGKPDVGPSGDRRRFGARRGGHHPVDRGHDRCSGAATPSDVRRRLSVGHVPDTHDGCGVRPEAPSENDAQTIHQHAPVVQPDRRKADQGGHGTCFESAANSCAAVDPKISAVCFAF